MDRATARVPRPTLPGRRQLSEPQLGSKPAAICGRENVSVNCACADVKGLQRGAGDHPCQVAQGFVILLSYCIKDPESAPCTTRVWAYVRTVEPHISYGALLSALIKRTLLTNLIV